jgi:hypothetical protein
MSGAHDDRICVGCGMSIPFDHKSDPICAECLTLPGNRRMLAGRTPPSGRAGATNGVASPEPPLRAGGVLPLVEIRRLAQGLVEAIDRGDLSETDRIVRDLMDDWSALDGAWRSERNRQYLVTGARP